MQVDEVRYGNVFESSFDICHNYRSLFNEVTWIWQMLFYSCCMEQLVFVNMSRFHNHLTFQSQGSSLSCLNVPLTII